ncbi:MAG: cysteine synthase A [Rhodospirillales bacterium]
MDTAKDARAVGEFRGRIYDSIVDTVGATPLVRLKRMAEDAGVTADIVGKCEFFNPLASVKDRIGLNMIEAAERDGRIQPGATLVEPTSGNTGIALAFVAAAKGYRLILTMPESMSLERRKMLYLLGATLELTPATLGMRGAIERAKEIVATTDGAIMLQQFENPANPEVHRNTTAEEIWKDAGGKVDVLISGVGTGGTLTGCAQVLRKYNPNLKVVAVEPEDSAILSGGLPGPHKIQGIGAGFVPPILDTKEIDEVLQIGNDRAIETARKIARLEGLPCGISSGAAVAAALELAARDNLVDARIVVILPSFAERYLSTDLFAGLGE